MLPHSPPLRSLTPLSVYNSSIASLLSWGPDTCPFPTPTSCSLVCLWNSGCRLLLWSVHFFLFSTHSSATFLSAFSFLFSFGDLITSSRPKKEDTVSLLNPDIGAPHPLCWSWYTKWINSSVWQYYIIYLILSQGSRTTNQWTLIQAQLKVVFLNAGSTCV